MRTYNQIIEKLEEFSRDHLLIRSFGYGTAAMLNGFTKNNVELPMLYAQIESIEPKTNTIDYVFRFKTLDTRSKNYDNLRDLQSDTAQIMLDLRQWLVHNFDCNAVWLEHGVENRMTPLVNVTQDWLSGWEMTIRISSALVDSDCLVPIEGDCDLYVDEGYVKEGYLVCDDNSGQLYQNYAIPTELLLRRDKGTPLTHDELDDNLVYLDRKIDDVPEAPDLSEYVKIDGSTPFTGIQKGIEGVEPDDLATVSQLGATQIGLGLAYELITSGVNIGQLINSFKTVTNWDTYDVPGITVFTNGASSSAEGLPANFANLVCFQINVGSRLQIAARVGAGGYYWIRSMSTSLGWNVWKTIGT